MELCRPDGTLLEANEASLMFAGLEREDVIGKPYWKTAWWSSSEEAQQRLRQAVAEAAEGNFVRYEVEVAGGGDKKAVIDFSLKPVTDASGRVVLLIAEGRDITRLKTALDRLRRSETMLAEAQRVAHLGSWEWEIASDTLTWSDELYRVYGVSPEGFTPTYERFLQMVHPEDRERVDRVVQTAYESQEPFGCFHRIVRRDGIVRTLHARGYPVVDEGGNTVRMYGTGQDVTDQRQTEEALRKSEKSYRTLARNIPDAIVALYDHSLNLVLLEGNLPPAAAAGLMPGTSLRDIFPSVGAEFTLQPFLRALEGEAQVFEQEFDGQTYLFKAVPVRDENGEIFAGMAMAQDITAHKQSEQKLLSRAQQLSALHEMGQTVAASLDLEIVFSRVLETLRPLVGAEGVFVLLCEGPETLVFAAANEVGVGNLTGQRVPSSRGVASDVLRTGELQWLHGEATIERVYHELREVAHYRPRAIIAAPMKLHGELIGVMEAVHSLPDAFGEEERAMMETAASWVAIAIGNARQHGRLQHQLQESEALARISRALGKTLDLDRILSLIVESARDLMAHADWSIFYTVHVDGGQRQLVPAAYAGLEPAAQDNETDKKPEGPAQTEKPFLLQQLTSVLSSSEPTSDLITYQDEEGALIAVPVRGHEGRLGILSVQSARTSAFGNDDRRLLKLLGRQAAMALENARLFREQQEARRAADTLRAANVALSQSLKLRTVLETLLDYADELIGCEFGLVLLARRPGLLHVEAARGFPDDLALPAVLSEDSPTLRQLQGARSGLILDRVQDDEGPLLSLLGQVDAGSWLLIPLLAGPRIAGLLVLGHRKASAYGVRQATLGEGLAAQATVAIQNARLFAEVQSSQERLRGLSRQIVNAQEEERQRISRELHDEAGQALTALKISLEMVKAGWSDMPEFVEAQLGESIEMTDQTMEQIRLLAHDLRPPVLDTFGLNTSVEGLARDFGRRTRLEIDLQSEPLPALPDAVAVSFYRFVQEALTNVARHADASKVGIELRRESDKIMVSVTDNGRGFDVESALQASEERSGIGLVGMQDRFELLNGWVKIESSPGQGTTVSAYVPFEEDA
ncbi:MAG TPA: GAF domain-containing protein [Candidatus Binatia bacterium]|nr:GAF domain-containing protein [Candidatus Binatia bacterium]